MVFQRAVYRWMLEPADRDAVLANVLSPEEVLALRRAYHNRYKHSLEEDVAAHTTGHLRQASYSIIL